jgi:adenosylcobinamide-GDP ribazoletransferase
MKGLIIATQFLTRLPTPRVSASDQDFAASMRWFPVVGLILGGLIALGTYGGMQIDSWTGALAGLVLWVAITGALHLDGLGDIADAAGAAHKDRQKLLAVLGDPHVGSFAVVTIALQLLAKFVLIHAALDAGKLVELALIPFAARIGPLIWTRWLPSLHQGLAARFQHAIRTIDIGFWSIALLAAGWFAPALLATFLFIPLWGWWIKHRIGGISGDGHGAGIELVETGLLLALVICAKFS